MAATVEQAWKNASEVIDESAEVPYYVIGAADEDAVRTACEADIPETYDGMDKRNTRIVSRLSEDTWLVIACFAKDAWAWPDTRMAFDTTGGTQHVTQAIETVNKYGPKATDENKGAVGFDGKNVQGVDITVPVMKWSETHYFLDASITDAYKATLRDLTGKVNDDSFKGFDAGEVLFLGAQGTRQGDDTNDLWEITFNFASSPNRTNIAVGDITVSAKWGWEYMDIRYADVADEASAQVLKQPVAVYIQKLYHVADFSDLSIGT